MFSKFGNIFYLNKPLLFHPGCLQGRTEGAAGDWLGTYRFTGCWEGKESWWDPEWENVPSPPKQLPVQIHYCRHAHGAGSGQQSDYEQGIQSSILTELFDIIANTSVDYVSWYDKDIIFSFNAIPTEFIMWINPDVVCFCDCSKHTLRPGTLIKPRYTSCLMLWKFF